MCGEFDIKTCLAMLIMDRLGIGGSFAEFHPVDFEQDTVLVGHDGPHHIQIADSKPVLRSLKKYHGKPGSGAGVEFRIKEGPITMLSIGQRRDGKFKFVIAEGLSGKFPIPPTGNTNTHGIFKPDVNFPVLCRMLQEISELFTDYDFLLGNKLTTTEAIDSALNIIFHGLLK